MQETLIIPFTWKERRSVLLDRCLYIPSHYDGHAAWERVGWGHLFGNDHPVSLEFCSGNGQWIVERAKENPGRNWVAVEKRFDRALKCWKRGRREGLNNLFVVCGEGKVFAKHYAPLEGASQLFINFPDPWPKKRHAKHRIVSTDFLEELSPIATQRATLTLVSDDPVYVKQMVEVLQKSPPWHPLFPDPYYVTEWPSYGDSFFSELWRGKGCTIHYLHCEKR